jgi:hypothetical protein
VAELADAQASGACGLNAREGSTPFIRICFPIFPLKITNFAQIKGFKSQMSIIN